MIELPIAPRFCLLGAFCLGALSSPRGAGAGGGLECRLNSQSFYPYSRPSSTGASTKALEYKALNTYLSRTSVIRVYMCVFSIVSFFAFFLAFSSECSASFPALSFIWVSSVNSVWSTRAGRVASFELEKGKTGKKLLVLVSSQSLIVPRRSQVSTYPTYFSLSFSRVDFSPLFTCDSRPNRDAMKAMSFPSYLRPAAFL